MKSSTRGTMLALMLKEREEQLRLLGYTDKEIKQDAISYRTSREVEDALDKVEILNRLDKIEEQLEWIVAQFPEVAR